MLTVRNVSFRTSARRPRLSRMMGLGGWDRAPPILEAASIILVARDLHRFQGRGVVRKCRLLSSRCRGRAERYAVAIGIVW